MAMLDKTTNVVWLFSLEDMVGLLARCSKDVYSMDNKRLGTHLKRIYDQKQMFGKNGIQFAVYRILSGANKGDNFYFIYFIFIFILRYIT